MFFLIKNHFVYKNCEIARTRIFNNEDWNILLKQFSPANRYNSLVLNPFKWTYKQMFQDLEDEIKRRENDRTKNVV